MSGLLSICNPFQSYFGESTLKHKSKTMTLVLLKWLCLGFLLAEVDSSEVGVMNNSVVASDSWDIRSSQPQIGKTDENKEIKTIIVKTEHGDVRGYESEPGIIAFFDIPYGAFEAERPFQEPTAPASWESEHKKTEHSSHCPQITENKFEGSNECLTLTIFKPKDAMNAGVLFHVHDSFFVTGSGDPLIYGPKYLVSKGIILVLPNYRLGPLGFLCLRNESAPGNAGLKDLTLALSWTMNNIEAFGGNSTNIVASGAGAGGALVEYLLLSNYSNGFISKAITESGSALAPWAIDRNPIDNANLYLERLKDEGGLGANLEVLIKAGVGLTFRPCVEYENGFLTESPWRLLQNGKFTEFTYMSGSANQAAMEKVLQLTSEGFLKLNQNITQLLPDDLEFESDNEKANAAQQVKTHYFNKNQISKKNMKGLSLCYSDSQYINSGIRAARLFAKGGTLVYFYEFALDHILPFNASARGDTLLFIFSKDKEDSVQSSNSIDLNSMKDLMINLWINFIKNGKPSTQNVEWETLDYGSVDNEAWLSIGSRVMMQRGLHVDRLKLWNDLYNSHYVDRNIAFEIKPSLQVAIITLVLNYFWDIL